jgi:D-alanine-D-alanine ligase
MTPKQPRQRAVRAGRRTVLVLVDRGNVAPGTWELSADQPEAHVVGALRRVVKKVVVRPFLGAGSLLSFLDEEKPDVVFNLTEHVEGDRRGDAHVAGLLELVGLPYTGTGPQGLTLCRDKAISKLIAAREGFRVPGFFVLAASAPRLPKEIAFPVVLKPRLEDSSEGISEGSLVQRREALVRRIGFLRRRRFEQLICEEFVPGREIFVEMLDGRLMPPREFVVGRRGRGEPRLVSERLKRDRAYRKRWAVRTRFARLKPAEEASLLELTRRTFRALELRDYARFDLKLQPAGEWVFLEANPNPPLVPPGKSFSGSWSGVDYVALIEEITLLALRRRR